MIYLLTYPSGRVEKFYLLSCAELYQRVYGGHIHSVSEELDQIT
jgi:hypothetical protein